MEKKRSPVVHYEDARQIEDGDGRKAHQDQPASADHVRPAFSIWWIGWACEMWGSGLTRTQKNGYIRLLSSLYLQPAEEWGRERGREAGNADKEAGVEPHVGHLEDVLGPDGAMYVGGWIEAQLTGTDLTIITTFHTHQSTDL